MAKDIGEADKLKNDFISTVSHELRTPLTAIKGWGETILEMNDSDPAMTKGNRSYNRRVQPPFKDSRGFA